MNDRLIAMPEIKKGANKNWYNSDSKSDIWNYAEEKKWIKYICSWPRLRKNFGENERSRAARESWNQVVYNYWYGQLDEDWIDMLNKEDSHFLLTDYEHRKNRRYFINWNPNEGLTLKEAQTAVKLGKVVSHKFFYEGKDYGYWLVFSQNDNPQEDTLWGKHVNPMFNRGWKILERPNSEE